MAAGTVNPFPALLKRHAFASACLTLSLVLAGVDLYLWQQSRSLERIGADRSAEGEATLTLLATGPLLRQQQATAAETVKRIEDNLLVEGNLADNAWQFYKFEEPTGARIRDLGQMSTAADGARTYKTVPFSLQLSGTFEQVAAFVHSLESDLHLMKVTDFTLQRGGANSSLVSLNLSVVALGKP